MACARQLNVDIKARLRATFIAKPMRVSGIQVGLQIFHVERIIFSRADMISSVNLVQEVIVGPWFLNTTLGLSGLGLGLGY